MKKWLAAASIAVGASSFAAESDLNLKLHFGEKISLDILDSEDASLMAGGSKLRDRGYLKIDQSEEANLLAGGSKLRDRGYSKIDDVNNDLSSLS